jgi:hypothetical protein
MSSFWGRVPRLSPAMLLALVALGLGCAGLAVAATQSSHAVITACYVKKSGLMRFDAGAKSCHKNENKVSWNAQGRQGATGARGPSGTAGAQGLPGLSGANGSPGAPGSPAASMLAGAGNTAVTSSASVAFADPLGRTTSVSSPESDHDQLSPNATVVARDLAVTITGPTPNGGTVFTFAIRVNGSDTAVQCSIPAGQASCNSGSSTAQIPPGSLLAITTSATGTVDGQLRPFVFGWRATTP